MNLREFREEIDKAIAALGDEAPVEIERLYGRTSALDDYDDYEGMPSGQYASICKYDLSIKDGKLIIEGPMPA